MSTNWSIFGEASTALLYGCYSIDGRNRLKYIDITEQTVIDLSNTFSHDNIYTLIPVIDLAVGLRWESTLWNDAYRLLFDLGWENHTWIDFNKFSFKINEQGTSSYSNLDGNLTLSGIRFRARFEF